MSNNTAFHDAVVASSLSKQLGENGMTEYTDTGLGSDILALSQLVRGGDPKDLVDRVLRTGSTADVVNLFVLLFATRNARGGKGEKKLAYDIFLRLYRAYPATALQVLHLFPHYGYWKDFLQLVQLAKENEPFITPRQVQALANRSAELMAVQLKADMAKLEKATNDNKDDKISISLLAKWLPREGSAFDKTTGLIDLICGKVWPSMADGAARDGWESGAKRKYRKTVAELTSHLSLPEVLLAAKREEEIEFHRLASRATLRLQSVLLNETKNGDVRSNDPKRIRLAERFVARTIENGAKGGQIMPHEIVSKIMRSHKISKYQELLLDAQWKDIVASVVAETEKASKEAGAGEFVPTRMVPLSDVSGSMFGVPMEVSIALGLLISETTHPAFKGMVLTFESNPRWHMVNVDATIVEKVRSLQNAPWGGSTDFYKAHEKILKTAEKNHLKKEDMPTMIVFSDMQFNMASHGLETMHEKIRRDYERTGKKLGWSDCNPEPMVYWNLRNTGGHPVNKDSEGAVLLSGFSPSLLKLVMFGGALETSEVEVVQEDGSVVTKKVQVTPAEVLRKMLNDKLYDPVRVVLGKSVEGKLLEYECLEAETTNTGIDLNAEESADDKEEFELI